MISNFIIKSYLIFSSFRMYPSIFNWWIFLTCFNDLNLPSLRCGFGKNVLKDCLNVFNLILFISTLYSPPKSTTLSKVDNWGVTCEYKNSLDLKLPKFLSFIFVGFSEISFTSISVNVLYRISRYSILTHKIHLY